ncbi:MAG: ETC complex I subunit [Rhodospirillales bacterium]|nr:ETC complex I subunit [Rhodospirillales bacterium]
MTTTARIFKPAKTAMQSGRARTKRWVLEFEPAAAKRPDPLMGWAGSPDTGGQVQLRFASQDEAIAYAERHGIEFVLAVPHSGRIRPKAYADNFKFDRVR